MYIPVILITSLSSDLIPGLNGIHFSDVTTGNHISIHGKASRTFILRHHRFIMSFLLKDSFILRGKDLFHLLLYHTNGSPDQAETSIWVSQMCAGAQALELFSDAFPILWARSWIRNGTTASQNGDHMESWHCRQQHYPPHHSAGPSVMSLSVAQANPGQTSAVYIASEAPVRPAPVGRNSELVTTRGEAERRIH